MRGRQPKRLGFRVGDESKYYVGIDPGLLGGLAMVNCLGHIQALEVMPCFAGRVDPGALYRLLESMTKDKDVIVYLEKAHCMPMQGRVSIMNYGIYAGFCEMALAALALPFEMVVPQTWQRVMFSGIQATIKDPKIKAALKIQRLFGLDQFQLTGLKVKRPHPGLIDATLISLFGLRQNVKAANDPDV